MQMTRKVKQLLQKFLRKIFNRKYSKLVTNSLLVLYGFISFERHINLKLYCCQKTKLYLSLKTQSFFFYLLTKKSTSHPLFSKISNISASLCKNIYYFCLLKKFHSLLGQISLNFPLFSFKYSLWAKERGKCSLWVKEAKKTQRETLTAD